MRLEAARRNDVLGEAWARNLEDIQRDGVPFDLVAFTGDLGDRGDPTDYDEGIDFLRGTCERLRVPIERLFLVPGNHDVNRRVAAKAWRRMREVAAEDPDAVSRWLAGAPAPRGVKDATRDAVLERTGAFWAAVERLDREALLPKHSLHGRLGYRMTLGLPGLPIPVHILGLDSAWLAGDDGDSGRLLITEDQINLLATDAHGQKLEGFRLALVHHPLSDLAGTDAAFRKVCQHVDLLLRGHQHQMLSSTLVTPDWSLHELAAGCLFEGDLGNRHPNGCQVIDIAFDERAAPTVTARLRSWSVRGGHWHDDSSLYRHAEHGRLTFRLSGASTLASIGEAPERGRAPSGPDGARPASGTSPLLFPELLDGIEPRWSSRIRDFLDVYVDAPFGGREAELNELDEWLGDATSRRGLLVAGAGRGKSALLVSWIRRVAKAGLVDVVFMPVSLRFGTDRMNAVARSIAARLRLFSPRGYAAPPDDPADALRECKEVFRGTWPGARPLLIVIDGLDEALDWHYMDLIPSIVGENVKLLVAARQLSTNPTDWAERLRWTGCTHLALRPLTSSSVAGVVASMADLRAVADDESLMERFCTLTGGDPLIVQLYLNLLRQGRQGSPHERMDQLLRERSPIDDPLTRFFEQWEEDQRRQWGPQSDAERARVQEIFNLLACAKGPLGLADLRELTGIEPETLRRTLESLGRFVIVDQTADRYVFSHSRLQVHFSDRLLRMDDQEQWQRRFLEYGEARRARLETDGVALSKEQIERRFGYVIRHHALHLKETAPADLLKLISRAWMEGWRALEDEDGVFDGFYEDVSRAETQARTMGSAGARSRALLVKASIATLSSNVPALLMRRLVETRRWPLSRALRRVDQFVADDERASALHILAGAAGAAEQKEILDRAIELPWGYRVRALVFMMPRLTAPLRELAFGALLAEGWLLQRSGLLKRLLAELAPDEIARIRELGHPLPASNPEYLADLLLAIASSAKALSRDERRDVLEECMAIAPAITDAEPRARRLCDMAAVAAGCAPEARERLLQSAWDAVRTLRSNRKGEPVLGFLETLLDQSEAMAPSARQEVIDAAWGWIEDPELGWFALSGLGPGLARIGLTSRVLKRCDAILSSAHHEHTRGVLLASLLPHGGDLSEQILERLRRLRHRDLALDPLASKLRSLTPDQREACISEVLEVVSRSPSRADLLGRLGGQMNPNDPDASRLLAAIRRLEDPASRAEQLVDCLHLVPEAERGSTVEEIVRGAREIRIIELKKRLVTRLVATLQAGDDRLPSVLDVSRQVGDEGLLSEAVDRIASMLAQAGNVEEADVLARRAAETFAREPHWGVETTSRSWARSRTATRETGCGSTRRSAPANFQSGSRARPCWHLWREPPRRIASSNISPRLAERSKCSRTPFTGPTRGSGCSMATIPTRAGARSR